MSLKKSENEYAQLGRLPLKLVNDFDNVCKSRNEKRATIIKKLMEDYITQKTGLDKSRFIEDDIKIKDIEFIAENWQFRKILSFNVNIINRSDKEVKIDRMLGKSELRIGSQFFILGEWYFLDKRRINPKSELAINANVDITLDMIDAIDTIVQNQNELYVTTKGTAFFYGAFPEFPIVFNNEKRIAQSDWKSMFSEKWRWFNKHNIIDKHQG